MDIYVVDLNLALMSLHQSTFSFSSRLLTGMGKFSKVSITTFTK